MCLSLSLICKQGENVGEKESSGHAEFQDVNWEDMVAACSTVSPQSLETRTSSKIPKRVALGLPIVSALLKFDGGEEVRLKKGFCQLF